MTERALREGRDVALREWLREGVARREERVEHPLANGRVPVDLHWLPLEGAEGGFLVLISREGWLREREQRRSAESAFQTLLSGVDVAVWGLDAQGVVRMENALAGSWPERPGASAMGHPLQEVFPVFLKVKPSWEAAMVLGQARTLEPAIWTVEGREIPARVCLLPLPPEQEGEGGVRVLVVVRDLSVLRRMEESLHQVRKQDSLGLLIREVLHDFNNVMTGMQGIAHWLESQKELDAGVRSQVSNLSALGRRATNLLAQIRHFGQRKAGEAGQSDVNQVLGELLQVLRLALKGVEIRSNLDQKPLVVPLDGVKVEQILLNLLLNARDALRGQPGPEIQLETRLLRESRRVRILVTDNGPGVAPELLERVFEPFVTTRETEGGTGLGLSTSRRLAESVGGMVRLHVPNGARGTVAEVILPLWEAPEELRAEEQDAVGSVRKPCELKGLQALVVDDEEVILDIGSELLGTMGVVARTARSGAEALALFRQDPSAVDLVLLDVEMPGMTGDEVFRQLREIRPDLPIILASGYSREYVERHYFHRQVEHFLPKPFRLDLLVHKLQQVAEACGSGRKRSQDA